MNRYPRFLASSNFGFRKSRLGARNAFGCCDCAGDDPELHDQPPNSLNIVEVFWRWSRTWPGPGSGVVPDVTVEEFNAKVQEMILILEAAEFYTGTDTQPPAWKRINGRDFFGNVSGWTEGNITNAGLNQTIQHNTYYEPPVYPDYAWTRIVILMKARYRYTQPSAFCLHYHDNEPDAYIPFVNPETTEQTFGEIIRYQPHTDGVFSSFQRATGVRNTNGPTNTVYFTVGACT